MSYVSFLLIGNKFIKLISQQATTAVIFLKRPKRMGCFCLYSNTAPTEKCASVAQTTAMVGIAIILLFQERLKLKLTLKKCIWFLCISMTGPYSPKKEEELGIRMSE